MISKSSGPNVCSWREKNGLTRSSNKTTRYRYLWFISGVCNFQFCIVGLSAYWKGAKHSAKNNWRRALLYELRCKNILTLKRFYININLALEQKMPPIHLYRYLTTKWWRDLIRGIYMYDIDRLTKSLQCDCSCCVGFLRSV